MKLMNTSKQTLKISIIIPVYNEFEIITTPNAIWKKQNNHTEELLLFDSTTIQRPLISDHSKAVISPDGNNVVFYYNKKIIRLNLKSFKSTTLVENSDVHFWGLFNSQPRWSYDGKYIAFVKSPNSFRTSHEQIYVILAAGGEPWHLGKGVLLGWSRDSKYIYYHRYMQDWFIYKKVFDDPDAEPERVIYSPSYFPAISPDEKYVAYEHRGEILITDLQTRETIAA